LLLLAGCNRISHPKDLASVSITLARMSSGPAYSVTVHGTGDVEYEGFRGVPVRGQRTATLSQQAVVSLLREFDHVKFMSPDVKNFELGSDMGTVTVSVSVDGKYKQVSGPWYDDPSAPATEAVQKYPIVRAYSNFLKLAAKIDDLVGTDRWKKCSPECMFLILRAPFLLESRNLSTGDTLLLRAIQESPFNWGGLVIDPQTVIETGADVNAANPQGTTPLMAAAKKGDADVVRDLLAHGANPNAKDRKGLTAFDHARSPEIRQLLSG
jgi:hypothetical protein